MVTQASINRHTNVISKTVDDKVESVVSVTKAVENQLANYILGFEDPAQLVNSRAQLLDQFAPMSDVAQAMKTDLRAVSTSAIKLQKIGERSEQDMVAESALADVAANEIETVIEESKNSIVDDLIVGAVAGTAVAQLATNARYMTSGLFLDSSNAKVRRMQDSLRKAMQDGARPQEISIISNRIRKELKVEIPRTQNLMDRVSAKVKTAVVKFDSAFTRSRSKRNGITKFRYAGGVISETRDFCKNLNGAELTEEEIIAMWESENWQGKEPGDPFIVRGGYNCRHYWIPVEDE